MDQKVRRGVLPESWSLKQGVGPHTSRFPPNLTPFQSRSGRGLFSCKPTSSHLVALVIDALRDLWTAVGTDAPHNGRLRQCRGRCVARVCTARKMDGSHRTRGKPGGTGARQAVPLTPSSTNTTSKHTRPTPARLSVLLSTTDVREPAPPPHCRRSSPPVCACTKIGRSLWKGSARRDNQSYLGG